MMASPAQIAASIANVTKHSKGGSLRCNNCDGPINERGTLHSCAVCLNGETPSLRDLLCEKCRARHRKGHK